MAKAKRKLILVTGVGQCDWAREPFFIDARAGRKRLRLMFSTASGQALRDAMQLAAVRALTRSVALGADDLEPDDPGAPVSII